MTVSLAALSAHTYWAIALSIAFGAAVAVAILLTLLVEAVGSIEKLGRRPAGDRGQGRFEHGEHPAPRGDGARAGPDRGGSRGAGRVHERAHRRVRWSVSSTHALVLLSVVLAAGVVLVLAVALIEVRRGLTRASEGLATLASALQSVEAEHLRPLEGAVTAINEQFDIILGALPGIAGKAAIVAERRPR